MVSNGALLIGNWARKEKLIWPSKAKTGTLLHLVGHFRASAEKHTPREDGIENYLKVEENLCLRKDRLYIKCVCVCMCVCKLKRLSERSTKLQYLFYPIIRVGVCFRNLGK